MDDKLNTVKPAWIPLIDYAMMKGVSLSTLRRHIKAKKLTYKTVEGKYLLWCGPKPDRDPDHPGYDPDHELDQSLRTGSRLEVTAETMACDKSDVMELRIELQKANEEIAELKTLIAFYEENLSGASNTS